MEYLVGSLSTLIGGLLLYYFMKKLSPNSRPYKMLVSQSRIYDMLAPNVFPITSYTPKETQAFKYVELNQVKILMSNDKAYWIKDNSVYSADMENGIIIEDSAKVVDMMTMDDVQLDEMVFIIDKLTEGKSYDRRNPRDSNF